MTDNNPQGLFVPSLKFEKKTRALNKYIWLPVFFLTFVLVLFINILFKLIQYLLNIVYSYSDDAVMIVLSIFLVLILACIPNFCQFIFHLWTSYDFSNGKIIKGRINFKAFEYANINTYATDALALGGMIANINAPAKVQASRTAGQTVNIIALTRLNLNRTFVEQTFYTNAYNRKEYLNPRLMRETRYTLVYRCDNKKRLVIPKLYERLVQPPKRKASSVWIRILGRGLLAGACFFLIMMVDMGVNYNRNQERLDVMHDTKTILAEELANFGFETYQEGMKYNEYVRVENSTYRSRVKYMMNKEGEITDVSFQLYYNKNSEYVAEELEYLLSTVPTEYNETEKEEFIQNVLISINEGFVYDVLETEDSKVLIGTSNGYIDVHNY